MYFPIHLNYSSSFLVSLTVYVLLFFFHFSRIPLCAFAYVFSVYCNVCAWHSLNNKKKKKKIYNAHRVKHEVQIGGAGSRQVAGRSMLIVNELGYHHRLLRQKAAHKIQKTEYTDSMNIKVAHILDQMLEDKSTQTTVRTYIHTYNHHPGQLSLASLRGR